MEATGHYWYNLHEFLSRQGYPVAVLNPIQTAQQARQAIRKCKTDKYDAFHIANLLRTGQYKAAVIPDDLAMTCRQITRLRYRIVKQGAMIKQLVNSRLHPAWPEYEGLFSNIFGVTSMALLNAAATPKELMQRDPEELGEFAGDDTAAKNNDFFGYKIQLQHLITGPVRHAAESRHRRLSHHRSGGEHKIVRRQFCAVIQADGVGIDEPRPVLEEGKTFTFQLLPPVVGKFCDGGTFTLMQRGHVGFSGRDIEAKS